MQTPLDIRKTTYLPLYKTVCGFVKEWLMSSWWFLFAFLVKHQPQAANYTLPPLSAARLINPKMPLFKLTHMFDKRYSSANPLLCSILPSLHLVSGFDHPSQLRFKSNFYQHGRCWWKSCRSRISNRRLLSFRWEHSQLGKETGLLRLNPARMSLRPDGNNVNINELFSLRNLHSDHCANWAQFAHDIRSDHVDQCLFAVSASGRHEICSFWRSKGWVQARFFSFLPRLLIPSAANLCLSSAWELSRYLVSSQVRSYKDIKANNPTKPWFRAKPVHRLLYKCNVPWYLRRFARIMVRSCRTSSCWNARCGLWTAIAKEEPSICLLQCW